ncbi:sunset domain-containing protein [Nostoc sp.]|uniref:sunset domain-containing protein n=1 Tax=Nostoc sp. TaxID=1180 RepID=UPI002FF567AF
MNNQLKSRQLSIVLTLFTVLMLGSCGKKPEESASTTTTPQTPTAISQASPGSVTEGNPGSNKQASPAPGNTTTPSSNKSISGDNKTAVLAAGQKLGVKPQSETSCPSDALVKGKITKKRGNIYHIPKSLDYEKVKPDICFKDPATAQQAGFRAPK